MIFQFDITPRKTGIALSLLTALVVFVGYSGINWLEGDWQPLTLDWVPPTQRAGGENPNNQQPLVLQPSVPAGEITAGWETPLEEPPIGTASRDREIR